jgi:hypothetical protein
MSTTAAMSLDRLRRGGQAFMEELSREYYVANAGLKRGAELRPIYERHREVFGDEALAMTLEHFRDAAGESDERRGARILLEWLVEARASSALADHEERELAWEATAAIALDDGRAIPYQRAAIEIANTSEREERTRIERARARLVDAELAPLRRDRFQREKEYVESVGIAADYVSTFEALSGIDLAALGAECQAFLRETQPMWDDVFPETVRRGLGIDPSEATRADALALLRARQFDAYFPATTMEERIRGQVREMGIDPLARGRILFDTGEREGKRSRAFCAPVRIPEEVYLVLRPHGGQADWTTFLHELGHALHFAYTAPDREFEFRWLGDNSVTEGYAMLLDHLTQDAKWLARYTALERKELPRFLRASGFEELHFIRRYCGKLLYELELYGGRVPWRALPDAYVQHLGDATGFRYESADAFVDVDARFYAARYLRAWQLQAALAEALVERFDEDWWRNPRAGPWILQSLFAEGQREMAGELAQRVSGRAISFAPLVRSIERLLTA